MAGLRLLSDVARSLILLINKLLDFYTVIVLLFPSISKSSKVDCNTQ